MRLHGDGAGGAGLSIVVVNYGSASLLAVNLARVHGEVPDALVVVVDNYTTAVERQRVRDLGSAFGWDVIAMNDNRGFGGGVNVGVARALQNGCRDILLINPDARIGAPSVVALRKAVAVNRLTAVAPVIVDESGEPWFTGVDLDLSDGSMHRAAPDQASSASRRPWLTGACLLVTSEAWHRTHGFDERYFLYWEDVDFSHRLLDAGGELLVVSEAQAVHQEGGTQHRPRQGRGLSNEYYYFNIRNRLLYATAHLDDDLVAAWRKTAPRAAYEVLLRGGRRQFAHPVAPLRAAYRGLRDGRRIVRRRASLSR